MHRRVVGWHAFVVLRRIGGVGGFGGREASAESAPKDVNDEQQAEQREYGDQGDRYGAPAFPSLLATRPVLFRRRNWTDRTTGSRVRR